MKNLNKISILFLLLLGVTFTSCETTDLDLLDDPNDVTIDKADLDRFLVAIQVDYKSFMESMGRTGAQATRIEYMFGRTYINVFDATSTNFEWGLAYQAMFSNMKSASGLATDLGANKHLGVIKLLKASVLLTLVDFYGDIPFSEATDPSQFPFPGLDDDAEVYAAAIEMLDEAITFLDEDGPSLTNDLYYDNDFAKWKKLANTFKMGAYLNTRLVDSDALNKFNAIAANAGNYISSTEDDFQFQYGTSPSDPNTRHPAYSADYGVSGAGRYRSNWLMHRMFNDNDPRIRYYFYRQIQCTPGAIGADGVMCAVNLAQLQCSGQAAPQHYTSTMAYCNLDGGYWGRDHGNDEGIPPDSFRRTASGVYPGAGNFDDDRFAFVGVDQGGQGAGITPIMLASWVDLMRAEVALASNNPGSAGNALRDALTKHIAKVQTFASVDPAGDTSFEPSSGDITTFINDISASFNAADNTGKWNLLANQQFVAHYGNGIDSYNFYRRTGFPNTLQYNIEPSSGPFVRSMLYPADEAATNANVVQKSNLNVQVFWDNNPASGGGLPGAGFPFSN
jgi:hypothetical protein